MQRYTFLIVLLVSSLSFAQGIGGKAGVGGKAGFGGGVSGGGGGGNPAVTDLGGTCVFNSSGTITLSFSAVPSGSQIIVFSSLYNVFTPAVWTTLKASDGNNISNDNAAYLVAANNMYMRWGHYLSPGGINSIVGTLIANNTGCISAIAVTNLNASSPFDFSDSAITERNTATFTSQTISPTSSQNEVLVMGAFEVFSPFMASTTSGWVDAGQGHDSGGSFWTGISYKLVTSTTATYTDGGNNSSSSLLDLFTASYKQ